MKKMRFRVSLCLTMLAAMSVFFGCRPKASSISDASSSPTETPAMQTSAPEPEPTPSEDETLVVARVNGEDITLGQLIKQTHTTEMMFDSVSGLSDKEKAERVYAARVEALDLLIMDAIEGQKIRELGIVLTDEDRKQIEAVAEEKINSVRDYVLKTYPTLEEKELNEMVDSLLLAQGLTRELIKEYLTEQTLSDRLYEIVMDGADLAIRDAEVRAAYDTLLTEQKLAFDDDVSAYESALLANKTIVYRPVSCKKVCQLQLMYDDDVIGMLKQLRQYDSEDMAITMEEDQNARIGTLVNKAKQYLTEGTEFRSVLDALSCNGAYSDNYICEGTPRFTDAYRSAAASLTEIGEVSTAIPAEYGMYLLRLEEVLTPGIVPLADVQDALAKQLTENRAKAVCEEAKLVWLETAEKEIFEENIYTK